MKETLRSNTYRKNQKSEPNQNKIFFMLGVQVNKSLWKNFFFYIANFFLAGVGSLGEVSWGRKKEHKIQEEHL